jgi:hypothetical protein
MLEDEPAELLLVVLFSLEDEALVEPELVAELELRTADELLNTSLEELSASLEELGGGGGGSSISEEQEKISETQNAAARDTKQGKSLFMGNSVLSLITAV